MNTDQRYCSLVNTHESYHDVMNVFLISYQHYANDIPVYAFSNTEIDPINIKVYNFIKYNADNFRDQYLKCLEQVPYEFVLTFNDDYFLTATPDYSAISKCIDLLLDSEYSHIRFVRGPNFIPTEVQPNFYKTDNSRPYFFSQTLCLWKKSDLISVFNAVGPSGIARKGKELQFEVLANSACEDLGLTSLVYYTNEKKVGLAHYECKIVPHIVSAIVDGYWNTKEYSDELRKLEQELNLTLNPDRYRSSFWSSIKSIFS